LAQVILTFQSDTKNAIVISSGVAFNFTGTAQVSIPSLAITANLTSMDVVASRAETSKRSLYAHFESKEKLFLANSVILPRRTATDRASRAFARKTRPKPPPATLLFPGFSTTLLPFQFSFG